MNDFFTRKVFQTSFQNWKLAKWQLPYPFTQFYFDKINISSSLIYRSSVVTLQLSPLDLSRFHPKLTTDMVQTRFDQSLLCNWTSVNGLNDGYLI